MTTSDPGNGPEKPIIGALDVLDVNELTRLANEFMNAIPGSSQALEKQLGRDVQSGIPSFAGIPEVQRYGSTVPTETELRQLSSTLGVPSPAGLGVPSTAGLSVPSPAALGSPAVSPSSGPGIPGGFSLPQVPSIPDAFSFLEEIRTLVPQSGGILDPNSYLPGVLGGSNAVNAFPAGSRLVNAPAAGSLDLASQTSSEISEMGSSQIPGAVLHPNVANAASVYHFEGQAGRLFVNVVPVLEPYGLHSGLSNLNLGAGQFDVYSIRRDFPILQEKVNGHPLVWLDNAATTQKPQSVIDRLNQFYSHENSNIHRAAHELAARATDAYEAARESVRRFLNAPSVKEIVFVRGATEAINLVAQSWGRQNIQKDDEILITWLEHHANIVPWQMLCAEKGARLRVAPVDDHGQVILEEYERLLGPRTRLVAFAQVSNALGTVTPVDEMVAAAHRFGAKVLLDGAQAVSHMRVDVQEYDCDFYVFSGHKLFAPTGIGVLYGKSEILDAMRPWQGGGNMIQDVTFERTLYQAAPLRFEAGTGSIADAVGLGAAIDYLERIGMHNISKHEAELMSYATDAMRSIPGLHLIGTAPHKAGVLSFVLDGFRTDEISAALNQQGIAVRAGHHCAQPILRRFGVESTVRPSLALYNTCEDVDALIAAIWNLKHGRGPGPI